VDQVELQDVNPTYANVLYMDGHESTVSLRDLAPCPSVPMDVEQYSQVAPSKSVEVSEPTLAPDARPDPEPCSPTPVPALDVLLVNSNHPLVMVGHDLYLHGLKTITYILDHIKFGLNIVSDNSSRKEE